MEATLSLLFRIFYLVLICHARPIKLSSSMMRQTKKLKSGLATVVLLPDIKNYEN